MGFEKNILKILSLEKFPYAIFDDVVLCTWQAINIDFVYSSLQNTESKPPDYKKSRGYFQYIKMGAVKLNTKYSSNEDFSNLNSFKVDFLNLFFVW